MGAFEVAKIGARRFDPADPYHFALTISWTAFFSYLLAAYIAISMVFAALYVMVPGSVEHARPGSLIDAYFFSFETLAGAAYGEFVPASLAGHMISATETVVGMAFTAVMTGLVFVRFSKPRAKILFAEKAVVATHNSVPTLMIRVGNGRVNALAEASFRVTALIRETNHEGEVFYNAYDLALLRPHYPSFPLTVMLMHPIDAASPLSGRDEAALADGELRLFVSVEARDPALGAVVSDLKDYEHGQICWDMRYVDVLTRDDEGRLTVDLTRISDMETDRPKPSPSPDPAPTSPPAQPS